MSFLIARDTIDLKDRYRPSHRKPQASAFTLSIRVGAYVKDSLAVSSRDDGFVSKREGLSNFVAKVKRFYLKIMLGAYNLVRTAV